jgi:anti-sigma factor RsiW
MIKTFTPNDVLLYISHELPAAELNEFEEQLRSDSDLMSHYIHFVATSELIKKTIAEPSERSTSFILNYSKNRTLSR